jgi:hypothetical protein
MAWFKRSDGIYFEAVEGSATFEVMKTSGEFEETDAPITTEEQKPEEIPETIKTPKKRK